MSPVEVITSVQRRRR